MISKMNGTTFIHASAFRDRLHHHPVGTAFVYATGDLAKVTDDPDAKRLREAVYNLSNAGRIRLAKQRRPDLDTDDMTAFDYLATKRGP